MPLLYLRKLTATERTEMGNRHLARYLAFVAGAANAGGFLAVRQYTSHMSGIVAAMADNLALAAYEMVLRGLGALFAFLAGAFTTTLLVRWARSRKLRSEYALALMFEAFLLVIFGLTGKVFSGESMIETIVLLCFTMGLQNAIITKISNSVIRTTHITGMVTDIGIAFGRVVWATLTETGETLEAEISSLRLLTSLIALFFVGGTIGAVGFRRMGFLFTIPLALIVTALAIIPVIDDLRRPATPAA
jgi:uncharacterized membrane protein YoaK (UPF0700 family)